MEGRHCLSAASVISGLAGEIPSEEAAKESEYLSKVSRLSFSLYFFVASHRSVPLPDPGETESERREKLRQQRADIARCWIKYCLNLLQDAKKLLEVRVMCMT